MSNVDPEVHELQLSLSTITQELAYERSLRAIEGITKDEENRKLRFQVLLLEDENNDLHEQLEQEQQRGDDLEQEVEDVLARERELEEEVTQKMAEMRMKERETEILKAELNALQTVSTDGTKLLTEKLALARELATLKPELEHLRSQSTTQQGWLGEKLSLQRQLTTLQVELDNEKRSAQRAAARNGKAFDIESESQAQIDDLKKDLVKEKREREKADKALKDAQTALDEARRGIEKNKTKDAKASSQDPELKSQLEEVRKELAKEKRDREKAERAVQKSQTDWESQKSVMDDKLNAFRTKLRSTKDKLKETEAALVAANNAPASQPQATNIANTDKPGAKNPRKRTAVEDPDAAIGTPGDAAQPKRGKRAATARALGDKSTFSITPFLNRTASVARESPIQEEEEEDVDAALAAAKKESEATAMKPPAEVAKEPAAAKKPKALSTASSEKTNAKPRKKAATSTLAQVPEEPTASENAVPIPEVVNKTTTTTIPVNLVPKVKPMSLTTAGKPRKSLADFTSFTNEPEPQRRKRKLLGGGAKTLFDEDEGDMPAKPIPGKGMFGRTFSKGGFMGTTGGVKGMKKGNVMVVEGDFAFSPLKRDRRAGSIAR